MSKSNEPREVLTLDEVRALLRVSRPTVLKAIREEGLPARKIGRDWRFLRDEVLAWMRERAA